MKMFIRLNIIFSVTSLLIIYLGSTNGKIRKLANNYKTIYVDPTHQGSFWKIQAAIDSVPTNNQNWTCIYVKAGIYNEQVIIPPDKPFIYLQGEGVGITSVVWGEADSLYSATFSSLADNIMVSGITFVNSYNYPPRKNNNPIKPAVAARIAGDRSAFFRCGFLGYQDTLLDDRGRHFFKLCNIEGAVDFIFGGGQTIYQDCKISVNVGVDNPGGAGYITAQGRDNQNESNGFVFRHCTVTGQGKTLLGRAWKSYSRVLFYNSFLSDIVVPQGWDAWTYSGKENQITFSENGCQGPGSDTSNRVKWEKNLTPKELQFYASNSYIDNEGWIENLPVNILV